MALLGTFVALISFLPFIFTKELNQNLTLACGVTGACEGEIIEILVSETYESCMEECKHDPECAWYGYQNLTNTCWKYGDCDALIDSIDSVVSGQAECPIYLCDIPGFCQGDFYTIEIATSSQQCLQMCQADDECAWFSYQNDTSGCWFFKTCDSFDESMDDFVSSQRQCEIPPTNAGKVIIVGGRYYRSNDEYVVGEALNLMASDSEDTCRDVPITYPFGLEGGATGAIVSNTVVVCGGFSLYEQSIMDGPCRGPWPTSYSQADGNHEMLKSPTWFPPLPSMYCRAYRDDCYKLVDGEFVYFGTMSKLRWKPASIELENKLWIVGQGSEFIHLNGTWSSGPRLPPNHDPIQHHCLLRIDDDTVLLAGGKNRQSTFFFTISTQTWTKGPSLNGNYYGNECTLFKDKDRQYVVLIGLPESSSDKNVATEVLLLNHPQDPHGQDWTLVRGSDTFSYRSGLVSINNNSRAFLLSYDEIFELAFDSKTNSWDWHRTNRTLNTRRFKSKVALNIPDGFVDC